MGNLRVRVASYLFVVFCSAAVAKIPRVSKDKPLEEPDKVISEIKNIDDAVSQMVVSHSFSHRFSKVVDGQDIADFELAKLDAYIVSKHVPNSEKEIWLFRYHLSDPRFVKSLARAKKAGVRKIVVCAHLQDALDVDWGRHTAPLTDFAKARPKDGGAGAAIQGLLNAGFRYGAEDYGIFSAPIFQANGDDRVPLMHEKSLLFVDRGADETEPEHVEVIGGTGNLATFFKADGSTLTTRYNRAFVFMDPQLNRFELAHAEAVIANFTAGQAIAKLPPSKTMRSYFMGKSRKSIPSDSMDPAADWMELGFTDGKYELNNRIITILQQMVDEPAKFDVEELILSEFVLTNKPMVEVFKKVLETFPKATIYAVLDDRFVDVRGFGLGSVLDGYDVLRSMGGIVFGWGKRLTDRTTLKVYQRGVPGMVEEDPEGPPIARHVWHDKTMMAKVRVGGKAKSLIASRSYNASRNYHNAESQTLFWLDQKSWISQSVEASIRRVADADPAAVDGPIGMFRNGLAMFLSASDLDIPLETAATLNEAWAVGDIAVLRDGLQQLRALKSPVRGRPSQMKIDARIDKLIEFLNWHHEQLPGAHGTASMLRVLSIFALIAVPDLHDSIKYTALKSLLWDKDHQDEALRKKRIAEAWKIIYGIEIPPRKARDQAAAFLPARLGTSERMLSAWLFAGLRESPEVQIDRSCIAALRQATGALDALDETVFVADS